MTSMTCRNIIFWNLGTISCFTKPWVGLSFKKKKGTHNKIIFKTFFLFFFNCCKRQMPAIKAMPTAYPPVTRPVQHLRPRRHNFTKLNCLSLLLWEEVIMNFEAQSLIKINLRNHFNRKTQQTRLLLLAWRFSDLY